MLTTLLVVLAASPAAHSHFTWTVTDVRESKVTGLPSNTEAHPAKQLGKLTFDVEVLEPGEDEVRKLVLTITSGPQSLKGRSWRIEPNYGEAALTELTPGKRQAGPPWLPSLASTLIGVDPIIAASKSGASCDEATRAAVAKATQKVVMALLGFRDDQAPLSDATAECTKTPGAYAVRLVQTVPMLDQRYNLVWSGTVKTDSWRSSLALQAPANFTFNPGPGKTPWRFTGKMVLESRWTAAK